MAGSQERIRCHLPLDSSIRRRTSFKLNEAACWRAGYCNHSWVGAYELLANDTILKHPCFRGLANFVLITLPRIHLEIHMIPLVAILNHSKKPVFRCVIGP